MPAWGETSVNGFSKLSQDVVFDGRLHRLPSLRFLRGFRADRRSYVATHLSERAAVRTLNMLCVAKGRDILHRAVGLRLLYQGTMRETEEAGFD